MFRKINAKLENLFDQNSQNTRIVHEAPKMPKNEFQAQGSVRALENLSYIFTGEINREKLVNLFSQLSAYFEVGFLMQLNPHSHKFHLKDIFGYSKKMALPENSRAIRLPKSELFRILKTKARPFLNHFEMAHFDPNEKMTAYLIPISRTYTIVLISPDAEPWARLKIEALQTTLMKINFSL